MTVKQKLEKYPLFDVAVLRHGFALNLRDFDLLAETDWADGKAGHYLYRFTHCVAADYETRIRDDVWSEAWEDVFTDYELWREAGEPAGFVWATNWAMAYPGWNYIADSPRAREWSERLVRSMHEVSVETNVYLLRLVFHDLHIEKVSDQSNLIEQVNIPLTP